MQSRWNVKGDSQKNRVVGIVHTPNSLRDGKNIVVVELPLLTSERIGVTTDSTSKAGQRNRVVGIVHTPNSLRDSKNIVVKELPLLTSERIGVTTDSTSKAGCGLQDCI